MRLISISRILHAPIGEVWAVTSSFGAIQAWMPGISHVSLVGAGVGAERTLIGQMGMATERLTEINPTLHRVRYSIGAPAVSMLQDFVGGTDLHAMGATKTGVQWVAEAAAVDGDATELIAGISAFVEDSIAGLARFLAVRLE